MEKCCPKNAPEINAMIHINESCHARITAPNIQTTSRLARNLSPHPISICSCHLSPCGFVLGLRPIWCVSGMAWWRVIWFLWHEFLCSFVSREYEWWMKDPAWGSRMLKGRLKNSIWSQVPRQSRCWWQPMLCTQLGRVVFVFHLPILPT